MFALPVRLGCILTLLWLFTCASSVNAQAGIKEILEGESLKPAEVDPEIVNFFERFNKALTEQDTQTIEALFDIHVFVDELEKCMADPEAKPLPRQALETALLPRLAVDLCNPNACMAWARIQYKAVNETDEGALEVTTRQWDSEGIASKTTWYLRKNEQGLKLYDINQLDAGLHWSRMTAGSLLQASASPQAGAALRGIYAGLMSMADGDVDQALEQLLLVDSEALPEVFHDLLWCSIGTIYLGNGEFEQALAYLDRAVILESASPLSHYLRAVCLNVLERYDEALVEADRYARRVGVDADVLVEVGDAFIGKEEYETGFRAYEKALEDDPQHFDALCNVLFWLDDDHKDEFEQYYTKVEDRSKVGQNLAEYLTEVSDPVSLKALLKLHARLHPEDDWVKQYADKEAAQPSPIDGE